MSDSKPMCMFGNACYRRNPSHFEEFQHPSELLQKRQLFTSGGQQVTSSPKRPKLSQSPTDQYSGIPYGFYLTKIDCDSSNDSPHSIAINDILDEKNGQLVESAQFNFLFDVEWLIEQYPPSWKTCPLYIVFGQKTNQDYIDLVGQSKLYPQVHLTPQKLPNSYSTHHSKMMLLQFDQGLRIVIHTANMVPTDWSKKTQGVWISPILPLLGNSVDNCQTKFKEDLLEYLSQYKSKNIKKWHTLIQKYNFNSVKVFLISSVPGRHKDAQRASFGHLKFRKLLNGNFGPPEKCSTWPIVSQFSSIGSLGPSSDSWLTSQFLSSLSKTRSENISKPDLKCIYPTVENVRFSLEGYMAGTSLPYNRAVAARQPYFPKFCYQWKSSVFNRTNAMPHIKTYCRLSNDCKEISWFCLTSANLSKAAWGQLQKNGSQLSILSFEIGVLFLPKILINKDSFKLASNEPDYFPLPYDVPLTPYSSQDKPWIWDLPYADKPDRLGCVWTPN